MERTRLNRARAQQQTTEGQPAYRAASPRATGWGAGRGRLHLLRVLPRVRGLAAAGAAALVALVRLIRRPPADAFFRRRR
jgi:hypothetical protein